MSVGEIAGGLKDAFRVGSERVVSSLSRADGFNKASDVHILLPVSLKTVQSMLNEVGMGSLTDDLELRLNRRAEAVVTKASKLFGNAIAQMTIEHARVEWPEGFRDQVFSKQDVWAFDGWNEAYRRQPIVAGRCYRALLQDDRPI